MTRSGGSSSTGTRTFAFTLLVLLALVVVYVFLHWHTIDDNRHLHTEGTTVDAERMALLRDTADLADDLLTARAIAAPAVAAVLDSLGESVNEAADAESVARLFSAAEKRLVDLGVPTDGTQASRDSATGRITEFLAPAKAQAEMLVKAPQEEREVAQRLLEIELEQAQAAVLDYMAVPTLVSQTNALKEAARGLGYEPDSEVVTILNQIAEELDQDRPNRALAAEMLSRVEGMIQGLRTSLFWSDKVLRWVEVIAWSLAGILAARLISAGKFIGIGQYKPEWNRWWWAKIVLAPLMAVPVVAFLTYLTIDVQSGDTLGVKLSLKDQPIEVVIAFAFVIGMFSDQAYQFLKKMADNILPEDDESRFHQALPLLVVEDTPIKGRQVETVRAELEAKGFAVKTQNEASNQVQPGTILRRTPTDKKLKEGSEITLFVAQPPAPNQ